MSYETCLMLLGLIGGALGGCFSYFSVMFDSFKSPPEKPLSSSKSARNARYTFFILRVVTGAITGFVVTFFFIENAQRGELGLGKLFFIQSVSGVSSSLLTDVAAKATKWLN